MVKLNPKGEGEVNIALKNKRKERGLTQARVAEKVGITTVINDMRQESVSQMPTPLS